MAEATRLVDELGRDVRVREQHVQSTFNSLGNKNAENAYEKFLSTRHPSPRMLTDSHTSLSCAGNTETSITHVHDAYVPDFQT